MPSPFPGMNPYLEQESAWHDFHERFMPAVAEALGPKVSPQYVVRIDERVYVRELAEESRRFLGRADAGVVRTPAPASPRGGLALQEAPATVHLPGVDIERLNYVEIRDRKDWKLITAIELLSPANKNAGPDREQYLGKRGEILNSPVHFVEIDLLRGGPRMPLADLPACDYYVLVSRAEARPDAGVWPLQLRDRLPVIPVPLHAPDPDVELDLQEILHRIYDGACYGAYIYLWPPQPNLNPEDAAWAKQLAPQGAA